MNKLMLNIWTLGLLTSVLLISCGEAQNTAQKTVDTAKSMTKEIVKKVEYNTNDPKSMLMAVNEACGGMDQLKSLKDVSFKYDYLKPDGKKDISVEKYIFEDEVSWAKYTVHQENVAPQMEGDIVQFYDGKNSSIYHEGKKLTDPKMVGGTEFLRKANYMWFTMMYKLTDPGTIHTYKGQEKMDGKNCDVVHITYDPAVTGKEMNDAYVLYINPETKMVDNFKFSLPVAGINDPILLAKLTYKEMNGVKIVSRREMFSPNPEGGDMLPMVDQILTDIKFNNGFTPAGLRKEVI